MGRESPRDALNWLKGNPPLSELMERYPAIWETAGRELVSVMEGGDVQALSEYARRTKADGDLWAKRIRASRSNPKVIETALPRLIQSRMARLALEKCNLAAATGKASGKIRFNLVNGLIVQKLLFHHDLVRKPVSLKWFRFWWPVLTQKRFLMPLVQPKGIYCFYTRELIAALAAMMSGRSCLEIAAGDGTLTRFLHDAGMNIRATDDYSWSHAIHYPEEVSRLSAREALAECKPQVAVCSWPPPGNGFERHVFSTSSVELYVVIGSRYRFASGNWDAYSSQNNFEWKENAGLSRLVLPRELDSSVLIFQRKA